MFSFHDLEVKFGAVMAYQCLAEIEKVARIHPVAVAAVDPEIRLVNALHAQDAIGAGSREVRA